MASPGGAWKVARGPLKAAVPNLTATPKRLLDGKRVLRWNPPALNGAREAPSALTVSDGLRSLNGPLFLYAASALQ